MNWSGPGDVVAVNLSDLPPELRAKVLAAAGGPVKAKNAPKGRPAIPASVPGRRGDQEWRCGGLNGCGQVHVSFEAAQRCANSHGGARLECVLEVLREDPR